MKEIRRFSEDYITDLPFDAVYVDDYPAWIYYKPSIGIAWKSVETGMNLGFYSTGARYNLKDYSGEYLFDSKLKSTGPGIWIGVISNPSSKFLVTFTWELGILSTTMVIDEILDLYEISKSENSYTLKSMDTMIESGIKLQHSISFLLFEYYLAYAFQAKGKGLVWKGPMGEGDLVYLNQSVHPGWNGFRTSLGIYINLSSL